MHLLLLAGAYYLFVSSPVVGGVGSPIHHGMLANRMQHAGSQRWSTGRMHFTGQFTGQFTGCPVVVSPKLQYPHPLLLLQLIQVRVSRGLIRPFTWPNP